MSYAALMVYVDVEAFRNKEFECLGACCKFDAALIGFSARAVPPPFVAEDVIMRGYGRT